MIVHLSKDFVLFVLFLFFRLPVNKYKITVCTGDKRGAGTDANVTITLFGELGESGERKLDTKMKNDFERGQYVKPTYSVL